MTHAPLLPVTRWVDPQAPLYYAYPVSRLRLGASLGNPWSFARADTQSNLLGLWASEDQWYCGRLRIHARADGHPLKPVWTVLAPHSQTTVYHGPGVVLTKEIWVPFGTPHDRAVIWFVEGFSHGPQPVPLRLQLDVLWPPILEEEGLKRAEPDQREKRVRSHLEDGVVVAVTVDASGRPLPESRVLGAYGGALKPVSVYFGRPGTARLEYALTLEPGESRRVAFVLVHAPQEEGAARQMWEQMPPPEELYERTVEALHAVLRRPLLLTPSPVINRGFEWAKVNTLRTQSRYPAGYGFTNDPPQDILVVRDAAWYLFGNDFFTPEFSREMIELVLREGMEPHGKLTEFIRCADQPPSREDYGLNINDDTPLFLLALYRHAAATQDMAFLRRVYPRLRRAANYITSQMQDEDLVVCESRGTNVHGIASWRNIIPAYNLTGAVTEINAECCAALRKAAEVARALGHEGDARAWEEAAGRLAAAINERLVSPNTGLYVLARTQEGEALEAVTADIVFPVLFDVAPEPLRRRVVERLVGPGIWTPYGARTVPSDDPDYDPDAGYQLLGGVWPNLTAWIAYGARRDDPGRVAEALETIYRISEADVPAAWGYVVPGQFPERLHGETGVSRGMTLSPWMPPTYLWLAISGLMGVEPTLEGLKVEPAPPPGWQWMVLRELPFAGSTASLVWWRGTVHTSVPVKAAGPTEVYERDLSAQLRVTAPPTPAADVLSALDGAERVIRSPEGRVGAAAFLAGEDVTLFVAREAVQDPAAAEGGAAGAGEAVSVTWAGVDGERLLWQGKVLPGEAVRVRIHVPTLRVVEEERLASAAAAAVPQRAA